MPLKIMAVDDEPATLQLIRAIAAPLDHIVVSFDDSPAAAERGEKQRFDVTFVGMRMPQLDGFALVRQLRNSPLNLETTIVMLSATDEVHSMRKAFGDGADFVLTKPLTVGHLRRMLAAMDSPGWKSKKGKARLPLFTEVLCTRGDDRFPVRSMNISETGMLLQTSAALEVGQEVGLEFKIAEVRAALHVFARIVRNDETGRAGIAFIGLAPEDLNAIQLYVLGRLRDSTPPRDLSGIGMRRLFDV